MPPTCCISRLVVVMSKLSLYIYCSFFQSSEPYYYTCTMMQMHVSPLIFSITASACVDTCTLHDCLKASVQICSRKKSEGVSTQYGRSCDDPVFYLTYLNLLLEVFNVVYSQLQHVCCVRLLQCGEREKKSSFNFLRFHMLAYYYGNNLLCPCWEPDLVASSYAH